MNNDKNGGAKHRAFFFGGGRGWLAIPLFRTVCAYRDKHKTPARLQHRAIGLSHLSFYAGLGLWWKVALRYLDVIRSANFEIYTT